MNPVSCVQASLYEINVDHETKKCIYEPHKPIRVITFLVPTEIFDDGSNLITGSEEFFLTHGRPLEIMVDSNLTFLSEKEFSWLREKSFTTLLKDVFLPSKLAFDIDFLAELSIRNGNKSEVMPIHEKFISSTKEQIRAEIAKFWQS